MGGGLVVGLAGYAIGSLTTNSRLKKQLHVIIFLLKDSLKLIDKLQKTKTSDENEKNNLND
jgi:hypothetical protein